MENIAKLQDYICDYLDKELAKFYSFDVWKDLLVKLRHDPKNVEANKVFDRYGDAFKVRRLMVDVKASSDDWVPTLSIEYVLKINQLSVGVRAIIVKDKVLYVQLLDMFTLVEKFGEEFDYVREFEKNVVLMTALRG